MPTRAGWLLAGAFVLGAVPAWAQKYPGETIPVGPPPTPRPAPYTPPAYTPPAPRPMPAAPQAGAERDGEARQLAGQLPLDPGTANLQNRLPADVPGTIRRLGLRTPNGSRTDLRNRPATTGDVINALQH